MTDQASVQVIVGMGEWIYEAMCQSYLEFFKAPGLMGAAGWPGAATNELKMYFHERFFIVVSEELAHLLFPFLRELEKLVKELDDKAGASTKASIQIFKYLALVVVQDAADGLAAEFPDHDVHKLLKTSAIFRSCSN